MQKKFKIQDGGNCFAAFAVIVASGALVVWGIIEGVRYLLA